MRTCAFAFVATFLCALPAHAGDHLFQAHDTAPGYETTLSHVFQDAFGAGAETNTIVEPPSGPEYAVGTKDTVAVYTLFYLRARRRVRDALADPAAAASIGTTACSVTLDPGTAIRLKLDWQAMLRNLPGDQTQQHAASATNYYFAAVVDGRTTVGTSWDPQPGTAPGAMAAIVATMRAYCVGRSPALAAQLTQQVNDLFNITANGKT